jgi:hypothetical protein
MTEAGIVWAVLGLPFIYSVLFVLGVQKVVDDEPIVRRAKHKSNSKTSTLGVQKVVDDEPIVRRAKHKSNSKTSTRKKRVMIYRGHLVREADDE